MKIGMHSQGIRMSIVQDFKTFAMRGNIIDLATGVILGAAFGKIVSSLVENILMPPLGLLVSNVDFSSLSVQLRAADATHPAVILSYGKFVQTVFDFSLVALCIFLLLRGIEKLRTKEQVQAAAPKAPEKSELLLAEIRDLLKHSNPPQSFPRN